VRARSPVDHQNIKVLWALLVNLMLLAFMSNPDETPPNRLGPEGVLGQKAGTNYYFLRLGGLLDAAARSFAIALRIVALSGALGAAFR
jgi:hypothetical protein